MRHHNKNRKFGRERNQRRALLKSLCRSLVLHGKIETTLEKAKELRPYVEKVVTKAKNEALASRRAVLTNVGSGEPLKKLFAEIGPKYKTRSGGYTRIVKIWRRTKDGSSRAFIEFV